MRKNLRKFICVFTLLAFLSQLISPALIYAQDEENHQAQIDRTIAEYQKTYDSIMALEPLELGGMANFTLNAIDTVKSIGSDIKGFFSGESPEEREQRKKQEEYDKYRAQIDRANEQIRELKAEAQKTMDLLKSGSVQEAAKADPTKVYNSLDENAGALAVYQKALGEAGQTLLNVGEKLGQIGSVLGVITLVLVPIAVVFPAVAPALPVLKGITAGIDIAGGIIDAAGNTLITASEKAITDDRGFVSAMALETSLAAMEAGAGIITDKVGLGDVAATVVEAAVGGTATSLRDVNRENMGIAAGLETVGRNVFNSLISAAIGSVFDAGTGKIAGSITKATMADPSMDFALKLRSAEQEKKLTEGLTDIYKEAVDQTVDPLKSKVTDAITLDDSAEEENQPARSQPELSGGGNSYGGW